MSSTCGPGTGSSLRQSSVGPASSLSICRRVDVSALPFYFHLGVFLLERRAGVTIKTTPCMTALLVGFSLYLFLYLLAQVILLQWTWPSGSSSDPLWALSYYERQREMPKLLHAFQVLHDLSPACLSTLPSICSPEPSPENTPLTLPALGSMHHPSCPITPVHTPGL